MTRTPPAAAVLPAPSVAQRPVAATADAPSQTDVPLRAECDALAVHLLGGPAPEYVARKYAAAHRPDLGLIGPPADALDGLLLRLGLRGGLATGVADAYARRFRPGGVLRRKMVLLLAILESAPPGHAYLDAAVRGPVASVLAGIAVRALAGALLAAAAVACIGPAHLVLVLGAKLRGGRR